MSKIEQQYLDICREILDKGVKKENRTGTDTRALFSKTIRHDMSEGFPLLTTKKVPFKTMKVELEGFIKGITSKKWFQDRGCKIWNEWCNPQKVSYGTDEFTQQKMREEDDLGPCIYGASWRNFHDPLNKPKPTSTSKFKSFWLKTFFGKKPFGQKIDQLKNIVETLKTNPNDRRMICTAWNPLGLKHTALPACHVMFIVNVLDGKLNLTWTQRSVDWMLGCPFNIASYALLLHLLAKEAGLEEGELVGNFVDVHLYENHVNQVKEQLSRNLKDLPKVDTKNFTSIFDWDYQDTELIGYEPHPSIKAPVAI